VRREPPRETSNPRPDPIYSRIRELRENGNEQAPEFGASSLTLAITGQIRMQLRGTALTEPLGLRSQLRAESLQAGACQDKRRSRRKGFAGLPRILTADRRSPSGTVAFAGARAALRLNGPDDEALPRPAVASSKKTPLTLVAYFSNPP